MHNRVFSFLSFLHIYVRQSQKLRTHALAVVAQPLKKRLLEDLKHHTAVLLELFKKERIFAIRMALVVWLPSKHAAPLPRERISQVWPSRGQTSIEARSDAVSTLPRTRGAVGGTVWSKKIRTPILF